MEKTKKSTVKIGLLQALGIAVYVSIFALTAWNIGEWARNTGVELPEIMMMIIMLTTFIVSATICASLMFGYAIARFMKGERKEAYATVGYTVMWLVIFLAVFGIFVTSFL